MSRINFERYSLLHNELIRRLENGEITVEQAKEVNDSAFNKYIVEYAEEDNELEIFEESARQKYLKLLAKKQAKIREEIEKEKKLVNNGKSKDRLTELRKQYDTLAQSAAQYSARANVRNFSQLNDNSEPVNTEKRKAAGNDEMLQSRTDRENSIEFDSKHNDGLHIKYKTKLGKNIYNNNTDVQDIASYDKSAKENFDRDFGSSEPNNVELHNKINQRTEQSTKK